MRLTTPDRARRPGAASRAATPVVVAHRGASAHAPENTLAAVRRAVDDGADLVEVDVQRTADGVLVVVHDATLRRTTDARRRLPGRAPWRVADLTYAEVRELDAGAWRSRRHAGVGVPTLDEVLRTLEGTGVGLQLELKKPHLYPGVVDTLVATLERWRPVVEPAADAGRFVVQSFDIAAMKEHKTKAPHVPVGLLGVVPLAHLPAHASWAAQVNPPHRRLSVDYVAAVQAAGLACVPWTVDSAQAMRRVLDHGVDGVITNRPRRLRRLLGDGGSLRPLAVRAQT